MKVAILHDYLNQFGGAERVLKVIIDLFPNADLYTLLYDEKKTLGLFKNNIKGTSFLDHEWIRNKHRLFIPIMPFATEFLHTKNSYDLVISSTAGYAKGIPINAPYHISYCHSPLRYAWEIDYLKNLSFSPRSMSKNFLRPVARWLKDWDKNASSNVNLFIANSKFISDKIRSYYGRDSEIIFPPVNEKIFYPERDEKTDDYYLMAGRLLYYKGFDLGIEAFNRMKKKLKIVGRGPEEKKLRVLANPNYIEFIQGISDDELRKLYSNARAFIFPQIEDFGLVAAEAQMCGTPVIAFRVGGGGEIVDNKNTGLLFSEQSPEAIIDAVKEFENMKFDRKKIHKWAAQFSETMFKKKFVDLVRRSGFKIQ